MAFLIHPLLESTLMKQDSKYSTPEIILHKTNNHTFSISILVFLVTTVGVFPLDVYLPSIPTMALFFGVSTNQIARTISYFTCCFAISQLINGPLSDAYGRRAVLLVGLLIGGIATSLFLVIHNYSSLIILRIIQAIGLSSFVVTQAIIRDIYTGKTAVKFQIFLAVLSGLLIAISPLFGSVLQNLMGWQGSFIVCSFIIFLTLFYVLFFYHETNQFIDSKKINPRHLKNEYLIILKNPIFIKHAAIATLGFAVHLSFIISSPYFFIKLLNLSTHQFGFIMLIYGIFYLGSGILTVRLARYFSIYYSILFGGAFVLLGGLLMAILYAIFSITIYTILIPMIFITIGVTFARPAAITKALEPLPKKAGFCSASLGLTQYSGAGLLSFIVNCFEHYAQFPLAILAIFSGLLICVFYSTKLEPLERFKDENLLITTND